MIRVSSCPALPTNGSPCRSSSAPGASPTEGHVRVDRTDAEDGLRARREHVRAAIALRDFGGEHGEFATALGERIGRRWQPLRPARPAAGAIVSGSPRGTKSTPAARSDFEVMPELASEVDGVGHRDGTNSARAAFNLSNPIRVQ